MSEIEEDLEGLTELEDTEETFTSSGAFESTGVLRFRGGGRYTVPIGMMAYRPFVLCGWVAIGMQNTLPTFGKDVQVGLKIKGVRESSNIGHELKRKICCLKVVIIVREDTFTALENTFFVGVYYVQNTYALFFLKKIIRMSNVLN